MKIHSLTPAFLFSTITLFAPMAAAMAQLPISFRNPSFEDRPDFGKPPEGWFYCGKIGETPPDVHPGEFYGVNTPPKDGQTYVGMVTRDNGTVEQLGQRLKEPVVPGQCYAFRIFAARSEKYLSISRKTGQPAEYSLPLKLALLGAHRHCEPVSVLALSKTVIDPKWQQLDFLLRPEAHFDFLILAATSATGDVYNGNILLDAASPLLPCDCEKGLTGIERIGWPIVTAPEFPEWVAAQQTGVRFDADQPGLERHLFESPDGVIHFTNKFLWNIARFMLGHPKIKLQVAYNPSTFNAVWMTEMQMALEENGLTKSRFTFKKKQHAENAYEFIFSRGPQ